MTSCEDCSKEKGGDGFYCHQACLSLHRKKCTSDYTTCVDCDDPIDMGGEYEEWEVCGECEKPLCSKCMKNFCKCCKDNPEENGRESAVMCGSCMTSCEGCSEERGGEDFYCHQACLSLHHNKCIKQKKSTLKKFKQELESLPAKISQIKEEIAKYEKENSEKEREFKIEEEKHNAAKKRKHADS